MKTSNKMQAVVTKLANKHELDLTADFAHLRLDMSGYDRLVIEKIGQYLVSVAHYYEQEGDLIADPEIVFFTGYLGWIPIEVTQVLGGWRRYVTLSDDGQMIIGVDPRRQKDLADFAEMWARNIEAQGWLEHGIKWEPNNPSETREPNLKTLMRWEDEGGCEAACPHGCWVEPDGRCEHDHPSWLLKLGMI